MYILAISIIDVYKGIYAAAYFGNPNVVVIGLFCTERLVFLHGTKRTSHDKYNMIYIYLFHKACFWIRQSCR